MTLEDRRLKLHAQLKDILGSSNVYYDPPPTLVLEYPCIVYQLEGVDMRKADNLTYYFTYARYSWTLIQKDDDNDIYERLLKMKYTAPGRPFVQNNFHHMSGSTTI